MLLIVVEMVQHAHMKRSVSFEDDVVSSIDERFANGNTSRLASELHAEEVHDRGDLPFTEESFTALCPIYSIVPTQLKKRKPSIPHS